jgi:hypothetical protein
MKQLSIFDRIFLFLMCGEHARFEALVFRRLRRRPAWASSAK